MQTLSENCRKYGSREPTFAKVPAAGLSDGDKALRLLKRGGMRLLDWQADVLSAWLTRDDQGNWAAATCGLAVPRQNGKTQLVAARCCFGMVAYAEWVIYTAHLQKTATETFEAVRAFFESTAAKQYVAEIKTALGREEIRLTNGGRIKFLARTRNGGRGQHGDLLIFDEGQAVDDDVVASFLPCLAASKNPQTIYTGTPPDEEIGAGQAFWRLRNDARNDSGAVCWHEWAVDGWTPAKNGDRALWAATNPSYGYFIKPATIENEYSQMAADKFARERLGWWSDAKQKAVDHPIDADAWAKCRVASAPTGTVCYGVKFSPDLSTVSLSVAVKPEKGPGFVEGIENRTMAGGTAWLADWLAARKDKAAQIVVDGRSGSQALIDRLLERGVPQQAIIAPSTAQTIAAMATFANAVNEQAVTHTGQPAMTAAVTLTKRRKIGRDGGWGFDSTDRGDATLAESAALAFWASQTTKRKPGRRAVVF